MDTMTLVNSIEWNYQENKKWYQAINPYSGAFSSVVYTQSNYTYAV